MKMAIKYLKVVPSGDNAKLGAGVATTYRPVKLTCPPDCPLMEKICYAKRGNVNIHQTRSEHDEHDLRKLAGNTLVRHLVSGDWLRPVKAGKRVLDLALVRGVIALHNAAPWLTGCGYTHAAAEFDRNGIGPKDFPGNLHILASCDTLEQKELHNATGWRTARVIDEATERQPDEFLCPVDAAKRKGIPADKRTNCARCRACFDTTKNIAFLKF